MRNGLLAGHSVTTSLRGLSATPQEGFSLTQSVQFQMLEVHHLRAGHREHFEREPGGTAFQV